MKPQIVSITLLDHCQISGSEARPIECTVYGLLYKQDKDAYYVACWMAEGQIDDNTEQYVILKKAVKKLKRLK